MPKLTFTSYAKKPMFATTKNTPGTAEVFFVVDPTRYFSKYNFSDLELLCERLDKLDIEAFMAADNA